jgi:hypothetical protein
MKRLIMIISIVMLPQLCYGYGNGDVCITLNDGDNVVHANQYNTVEIRIANDELLLGMGLGFSFDWDPSMIVDWDMEYGNYPPVQEHGRAIDAWDSPSLFVTQDFNNLPPDHILIGGSAMVSGLPAGPSEVCYSVRFFASAPSGSVIDGFSVDPYFYPPGGLWAFADYYGTYPPDFCGVPTIDISDPQATPEYFDVIGPVDFDPDDGHNEVGVFYVDQYQGSVCGGGFCGISHWDAWVLGHDLQYLLSWEWPIFRGHSDVMEYHFDENNDDYVDDVDLVYFCGQGKPQVIEFRGMSDHYDETCQLTPDEVELEWGDKDLEWVIFNSAQTMSSGSQWAVAFNGLHGIMGFSALMSQELHGLRYYNSGMPAFMEWLALNLACVPVWEGFRHAVEIAYDPVGDFNIVGVFSESIRDQEWMWGTGKTHYDDPSPDESKWVVRYSPPSIKEEKTLSYIDLDDRVMISDGENGGPVVSVLSGLTARASVPSDTLYRLLVQHRTVDEFYVGDLADSFCYNYGWFCNRSLSYDAERGTYDLLDGPHALTVYEETGGWHYVNKDLGVIHGDYAPDLLEEFEVQPASEELWEHFGGLPSDTFQLGPFYLNSAMYTNEGELVPDSSWDVEVKMSYVRNRDGRPVFGPGAGMSVTFGDNAEIYSIHHGGWRDVTEGEAIQTVAAEVAIDNLAQNGWDVSMFGIPHHDELIIYDTELGYFEPTVDSRVDELQPVWFLRSYCLYESDTTALDLIVSAEFLNPYAEIIFPENDTTIYEGDTLFFNAYVYGTYPIECAWYSDIDGLVDTGEVAWVSDLSAVNMGGYYHSHLITLEATDGNGMVNHDYVFVTVLPAYACGDADGSGGTDIDDAVYLINYIFASGPAPEPPEAGDCDCSGAIDIDDVVWLINYIFVGGDPPCDTNGDGTPDC